MYLVFLVNKHDPSIQTVIFVHIVEPFQEGVTVSVSLFMKLGNMSVRKKTPNFLSHYILVAFEVKETPPQWDFYLLWDPQKKWDKLGIFMESIISKDEGQN